MLRKFTESPTDFKPEGVLVSLPDSLVNGSDKLRIFLRGGAGRGKTSKAKTIVSPCQCS